MSWTFLIIGTFAAVGAALAVGTGAALIRYYRTGSFPGPEGGEVEPSSARVAGLWIRVALGAAVAAYGAVSLSNQGLLF